MRYKFSNDYFFDFLPAGFPAGAAALAAARRERPRSGQLGAAPLAGAGAAPLTRALFRRPWPALSRRLWRRFLARLGFALGSLFLLLLDHLDFAGRRGRRFQRGGFLRLAHRRGDGEDGNMFVAQDFDARRRFHLADMDGLADFQMAHVGVAGLPANPWARPAL